MTKTVLEQIVELEGHCLIAELCAQCPFRNKCLSEFVTKEPPSRQRRCQMALEKLAMDTLLDENIEWRSTNR